MPAKRKPDETPEAVAEAQKRRFIETAKELGVDESGEAFEKMFKKIVPPKLQKPADAG
jgi:hypothetical protein